MQGILRDRSFSGSVARLVERTGQRALWPRLMRRIETLEAAMQAHGDAELLQSSLTLRHRVRGGLALRAALPEAFALVREAARRTIGLRPYSVQLLGGIALANECIAEMQTGEGKTLTATLPLFLHALRGRGAHLATANDYLARRDAEGMAPVYRALGLSVGVVQSRSSADGRRAAYGCDITYGTVKEFGFDFLRDRLLLRQWGNGEDNRPRLFGTEISASAPQPVQRGFHFALIDEADHVLIDEARTPLVIATALPQSGARTEACYRWCAAAISELAEPRHYDCHRERKAVYLTPAGRERVRAWVKPPDLSSVHTLDLYEAVERALVVRECFLRDRDYVVPGGSVVIVDESTGRPAEGRQWRGGIHQAVETKEGLKLSPETGHAARITVQELFRCYRHLAGMTGTAAGTEFRRTYRRPVVTIPTHRPTRRVQRPERVFRSETEKWESIVEEIAETITAGRPVLVGTRSVEASERLSNLLTAAGLEHAVLNARRLEAEAAIVARAGERSRITVATNMAGRGTDIHLPADVAAAGGLHVLATELHDSSRVDRQLIGRSGRQGDPGSFRVYLSLDDAVLEQAYGPQLARRLRASHRDGASDRRIARLLRRAQRRIEALHARQRRELVRREADRTRMAEELGQDPYLDLPDA